MAKRTLKHGPFNVGEDIAGVFHPPFTLWPRHRHENNANRLQFVIEGNTNGAAQALRSAESGTVTAGANLHHVCFTKLLFNKASPTSA